MGYLTYTYPISSVNRNIFIRLNLKSVHLTSLKMKYLFAQLIHSKTMLLCVVALVGLIPPIVIAAPTPQAIKGRTGGTVDSKSCGFVATTPSYTMSLSRRMDYMRMLVDAQGGQPTLLIVGPKGNDRFCVLGDAHIGLKPEISGVWEPGKYNVYVGDRYGEQHPFTLRILTNKN